MNTVQFSKSEAVFWQNFVTKFALSEQQAENFKIYLSLLLQENKKINLTTITTIEDAINYHFADSVMLAKYIDFENITSICDIGSGGGFPGIPLKILYPHLSLILIEVVQKKVRFLHHVINTLGLENAQVYDLDWRMFLRSADPTEYPVDLFCARASLQPEELVRVYKPSSPYKNSQLVYWAADQWQPSTKIAPFIKKEEPYHVGNRKRKFVFLGI